MTPKHEPTPARLDKGALFRMLGGGLAHRLVEVDRRARRAVVRNLSGNPVTVEGRCTERTAALLGTSLDFY